MIQIGLDLERLRNTNSGLGQFCLHLYQNLTVERQADKAFQLYLPKNIAWLTQQDEQTHVVGFWDKLLGVRNPSLQLFHATHQDSHLLPRSQKIKKIITIHDFNFLEKYKDENKKKNKLKNLQQKVDMASGVAFISKYTEDIARKHLQLPSSLLTKVIYNGNNIIDFPSASKPKWLTQEEYFFTIGMVQAKKNFHVLLPLVKHTGITLVIAGWAEGKYADEIKQAAAAMGIAHLVIMPGAISDEEKYWLFKNAKAFLFPSLAEGFGMPVVEAMNFGIPVFLSRLTSLPEIGGEQAFYWDSFNVAEMIAVLERGLQQFAENAELKIALKKRASIFSWQQAAKDYLSFYDEIVHQ